MNKSLLWSIFVLALIHVLVSFVMVVLPVGGEKTKDTKFIQKMKQYNTIVWFVSFVVVVTISILSAVSIKQYNEEEDD
ncbi:MAG: hypothetical protein CMM15_10800 [Rhodospirillaceae bacterium]|nr:hypothetical protein [Rhodospirillaceae bacterium]OUX67842.1 MAG: hypothetical protein CBD38_01055 [bacterium TMED178]